MSHYLQPQVMTAPGKYQPLLADLPHSTPDLATVAHGLLIHEHIAGAYGVMLPQERRASVHVRPVAGLLGRIMAEDSQPLTVAREPANRLPGNCRHFTVLAAAMLRTQGTPARARCGFGGYFGSGAFEDHWVCEYWDRAAQGWKLADFQIDDVQLKLFDVDFDLMDVPRHKFLAAGDAWRLCRAGDADPAKFGLSLMDEAGYWWIAANLLRDLAALNNMEMLPWDVWGLMGMNDAALTGEKKALLDRVAGLTLAGDGAFAEVRAIYESDDRLRVPPVVFNAIRNAPEQVAS